MTYSGAGENLERLRGRTFVRRHQQDVSTTPATTAQQTAHRPP